MNLETGERRRYVVAVLTAYTALPETPPNPKPTDRRLAEKWFDEAVSIVAVRGALLLGQMRRLGREADLPRLSPIRSLYYFVPILEEVLARPLPEDYLSYLATKLRTASTGACSKKRVSS